MYVQWSARQGPHDVTPPPAYIIARIGQSQIFFSPSLPPYRLLQTYQHEGMYLLRMSGDLQGKVLMVWYAQENKSKHYKVFGDNVSPGKYFKLIK